MLPSSLYASGKMFGASDYGRILSVSSVIPDDTDDNGLAIEGNLIVSIANVSAEYVRIDETNIFNAYIGIGLRSLFQIKVGVGSEEHILKIQSEIPLNSSMSLGKKPSFVFKASYQNYSSDNTIDGFQIGLGYLF
jgi:hypothetical protein